MPIEKVAMFRAQSSGRLYDCERVAQLDEDLASMGWSPGEDLMVRQVHLQPSGSARSIVVAVSESWVVHISNPNAQFGKSEIFFPVADKCSTENIIGIAAAIAHAMGNPAVYPTSARESVIV